MYGTFPFFCFFVVFFGGNLTIIFQVSFIKYHNLQIKITFSSGNSSDRYLWSIFYVLNDNCFIRYMKQMLSSYFCYFF